jgi:hypothetical protein
MLDSSGSGSVDSASKMSSDEGAAAVKPAATSAGLVRSMRSVLLNCRCTRMSSFSA